MEKTVSRKKRVDGFREKGIPFCLKSSPLFKEYDNKYLLNILNGGNVTNTVRHRMYGIHFSAAKRLVRKWSYH